MSQLYASLRAMRPIIHGYAMTHADKLQRIVHSQLPDVAAEAEEQRWAAGCAQLLRLVESWQVSPGSYCSGCCPHKHATGSSIHKEEHDIGEMIPPDMLRLDRAAHGLALRCRHVVDCERHVVACT